MPSLFSRLIGARRAARETKYSRAAKLLAMHALGQPHWSARNSTALTREGYERNAVCHRCVRMVAEAAASVPWLMYEGREESIDHPLLSLIERPNPLDTSASFIEAICANLLLYGNAYVESVVIDEALRELYALRPDRMSIEAGAQRLARGLSSIARSGQEARYEMRGEGIEPILHIKFFNPLDDYYGFPPLAAAQVALDTHNAASFWNKALLDNSARPSGALVYAGPEGAHLTDEQFSRLKEELEENFSGATNAGRPLLLEGGLDWKALSLSPKDMDFTESKAGAAREIALAFGVPPLLLGLPGDNTFSNYAEANRAFWRQTVLPLVARVQKSFQAWLQPGFGPFASTITPTVSKPWRANAPPNGSASARPPSSRSTNSARRWAMARRRKKRSSPNAMPRWSAATARISRACRREVPAPDNGRAAEAEKALQVRRATLKSPSEGRRPLGDHGPQTGGFRSFEIAGGFTPEQLDMSVQDFVSNFCKGSINSELPSQFFSATVKEVLEQAKSGSVAANKCKKLLGQDRFRKP